MTTPSQPTPSPGSPEEQVFNEGYRAQAQGKDLVKDNPHQTSSLHWVWRAGFLQAFKDSN